MIQNTLLTFTLFCTTVMGWSQDKELILQQAKKLYDAHYLMEFEALADLTYPAIYSEEGRERFISKLDAEFQNDEYRYRLQLPKVTFQLSDIQMSQGKKICFVTFNNPVRYFYEEKLTAEKAAIKKDWLITRCQTAHVTFEPSRNSFNVKRQSTFVAIQDESTAGNWKFIQLDDPEQRAFFEKNKP